MEQINLSFNVPISIKENVGDEKDFIIQGTAISSTVTDNGHKFLPEELRKAVKSLANRPFLKDHDSTVDSIIGKVISSRFDNATESIVFKARVNNTEPGMRVQELIKMGDLSTVSIGAVIEKIEEDEDGNLTPIGIKIKELSAIATPADDNAQFIFKGGSFNLALEEAYKVIETTKSQSFNDSDDINVEETIKIKEANMSNEIKAESEKEEKSEESEEKEEVEESINSDFQLEMKTEMSSMKEQMKGITEVLGEVLKTLKEADVDEEKEEEVSKSEEESKDEEVKEEPKEEEKESEKSEEDDSEEDEEEDSVDEQSNYKVYRGYNSFTVIRNK